MSGEALGWAWAGIKACPDMSPTTRVCYLALADVANDTFDHELWMTMAALAAKAATHRSTAQACVSELVSYGLLTIVDNRPGRPVRYRLFDPRGVPISDTPTGGGVPIPDRGVSPFPTGGVPIPDTELKEDLEVRTKTTTLPRPSVAGAFDQFWSIYPVKRDKGHAKTAFERALRKVPLERLIAGATRYRDDPNREQGFTMYAQGWLTGECWDDDPLPSRSRRVAAKASLDAWARRKEAEIAAV